MIQSEKGWRRWSKRAGRATLIAAFLAGVVLLVMWLAGKFSPKVPMTKQTEQTEPAERAEISGKVVQAHVIRVPLV